MSLKNLASLSSRELKYFLDSFDNVLCDCDGVIWFLNKPMTGVKETVSKLRECGKRVRFVSNNCTGGSERYQQKFDSLQLDAKIDDLAYPTLAIIDYFKTINYNKEIYLLSTSKMKNEFLDAGLKLADTPDKIEERVEDLQKLFQDDQNIGAVVIDIDLNLTYPKLLKASAYLRRSDVLFITAATDRICPIGPNAVLMGPGYFQDTLASFTNRVPIGFGKPGLNFNKYITRKFNIDNPSRTLFVGDSLEQDIGFASSCGYQTLLVLTGITTIDEAAKCTNQNMIPDYYINNLGELHELIKDKLNL